MVSSINGQLTAGVLGLLGNKGLARSMAAISSGNRLVSASTDISALSIATGLQTQVTSLRTAQLNISQAQSFLQVADGGLSQAGNILQRMQALAVQSNSGALSQASRVGINSEFQNLREELDRISGNTNFNGVNLLDGSLSASNSVSTSTAKGGQASGSLNFTAPIAAGQTVTLNGNTLVAGTDFTAGGSIQGSIDSLADALNNDSRFEGFTFSRSGNLLEIKADAAGEAGNQFTINRAASTAAFTVNGDALNTPNLFSLQGGTNTGLSSGDVSASGSVNNDILTSGTGSKGSVSAIFNTAGDIQAGNTISIDNGEGGMTNFTFVNGTPASANQIQIGSTLEETLQNAASAINTYNGTDDYGVRQLTATVNGNTLTLTNNQTGNARDVSGNPLDFALGTAGGSLTSAQMTNGTTGGVDVSGVTNASFIGKIQGFDAKFNGTDDVTVSLDVGGETYTARVNNTNSLTNNTVRFESANGGFFDVTLSGGDGQSVTDQAGADSFANRLDAAFSGLNFSQNRDVSNYEPNAQLLGSSLELKSDSFSGLKFQSVSVASGIGGAGAIEININGETFRATGLGSSIGANERVTLTSTTNPNRTISFTNSSNRIDISSNAAANRLEDSFRESLGIPGGEGASFQIGANANQTAELRIGDVSSASLFGGLDLDLLSAGGAQQALGVLGGALDYVTSQRAEVGSSQSALDYAYSELETAIQNQEAARAELADTDVAEESTNLALAIIRQQMQVATLAQGNRLQGGLLSLLQ